MSNRKLVPVLLIILLCTTVSLLSAAANGPHSLQATAESMAIGGSNCSDLMDGFAVGMGIGLLFGCVWCGAGVLAAKAIGLFC
jgi:hypothetical protein